ncbi:hypothetical protein FKN01_29650 [Streptomyces sp. 130]|uniref:hypothetical protein n=1 Tax=Streptomyces sp. 130 TaxID=2591006 RepID=UPI00117D6023|nr:hypothetical protein [Streptomyces sp. 130]TRV72557.1 hypothetical protein FKN01_29650 [Streptomyces sp. 130]
MHTRTTAAVLAAGLLATLTACGSSDDDKPATTSSAPTATAAETPATTPADDGTDALAAAVTAYTAAYFQGDADTAYSALSARCAGKITAAQYEGVVKQAATEYGPDHPATGITAEVSGDLARVTYKVTGLPKFDQNGQPWARESGTWHYDAC